MRNVGKYVAFRFCSYSIFTKYPRGETGNARWRSAEVEVLNQICREHGIEPLAPEKSGGTLEVAEYKEQRQKADALKTENDRAESEIEHKKSECQNLDR